MNATKKNLRIALHNKVKNRPWAQEEDRLRAARDAIDSTINGSRRCVLDSIWVEAWKEIGCKGKPTYKTIHALAES